MKKVNLRTLKESGRKYVNIAREGELVVITDKGVYIALLAPMPKFGGVLKIRYDAQTGTYLIYEPLSEDQ